MKKEKNVEFFGGKRLTKKELESTMGMASACPGCVCNNAEHGFESLRFNILITFHLCNLPI